MWDPRTYRDSDFGLADDDTFEPADTDAWDGPNLTQPHIMTVLGPIDPDELGICQPIEHILADPPALSGNDPSYRLDRIDLACTELETFFTVGGRSMVDVSSPDYGRDLNGLRTIARRVPINIIAVAGRHSHEHASLVANALDQAALEAEIGADLDGVVRPGAITFGTSLDTITPAETIAARAAARVAQATGYPVLTHTAFGTMGHEQLDLVEAEGLDPSRVVVGHLDARLDLSYLRSLAERGAWLSFDSIGRPGSGPDAPKASMLVALAESGYGGRLLISQGLARTSDFVAHGGAPGWIHLLERFTIELMEVGAGADLVRNLLINNPARALTILPPPRDPS